MICRFMTFSDFFVFDQTMRDCYFNQKNALIKNVKSDVLYLKNVLVSLTIFEIKHEIFFVIISIFSYFLLNYK